MAHGSRLVEAITERRRAVIAVMLVLTLALSGGVAGIERSSSLDQFKSDGPEAQQLEYAEANFGDEADTTTTQILVRDENVLSKESLIATLELQREFREDETVRPTLVEDDPFADLSTVVATAAIREERAADNRTRTDPSAVDPTLDEQIEQLESMDQSEIDAVLRTVLGEDRGEALVFMPTDYEPGSTHAETRLLFVTQQADGQQVIEGESSEEIVESQLAMDAMVQERFDDGFAFGEGTITDEIDRSLVDSLSLVLPLALLFVCLVLTVAYRDPLDILLGLAGIVVVLLWTLGFMGWVGIPFTQIMVAVPALLVGLSIDYAIHVFMRHRERREEGRDSSEAAMRIVLGGLGVALLWVTTTAVFGFLSNLVSPVAPIREFGVVSAFGIATALLVFGVLVPAAKVELDDLLEARGIDRRNRAFGTDGAFASLLSLGERAANRTPWAVVCAVLLVTAAGAAGATQVDTTFEREDFIADDPPAWMASLPGPLAPGEYGVKEDLAALNDHARQDTRTQVVVTGDVTDDRTLERVADAHDVAADRQAVLVLSNDEAGVRSPLSVMHAVAAEDESFAAAFAAADTDGDGVPDEDVEAVYDALYEADADRATAVIHRTDDGEYEAVRMLITMQGDASSEIMADDTRVVASSLDGDGLEATATGQPVVFSVVEDELFETVVQSLSVTLGAVAVLLTLVYRRTARSALLGVVTLAPIVCSVAWILGTMALLGMPFNAITGTITSLTVGLGVAYNIHMTERYLLERRYGEVPAEALRRSVRGTGGALLGSAATTIGGFGVLAFAILPPLQQFGLITGLTIVYAFVGGVFVLPSLLVLWERHLGSAVGFAVDRPVETATDGGRE